MQTVPLSCFISNVPINVLKLSSVDRWSLDMCKWGSISKVGHDPAHSSHYHHIILFSHVPNNNNAG